MSSLIPFKEHYSFKGIERTLGVKCIQVLKPYPVLKESQRTLAHTVVPLVVHGG